MRPSPPHTKQESPAIGESLQPTASRRQRLPASGSIRSGLGAEAQQNRSEPAMKSQVPCGTQVVWVDGGDGV